MRYIGSLDQGTTSTRFIVFDRSGAIVARAQKEHAQIYPRPGWVEHDALEIWRNTLEIIPQALTDAGLTAKDLATLGIANQRETTVLWDRHSGVPVHNALVWQDTRVDTLVAQYVREGGQDWIRATTGLPLASYFSALKLQWVLDNVAGARAKAERGDLLFGTLDSWLVWNLTGGARGGIHLTDVTNASRTQLLNLATLDWDPELVKAFRIPYGVLPRIAASSEHYGLAGPGPVSGVPITGILGDQQAALVGQTCFAPGEVKNTYGTGCFLLMNTGLQPVRSSKGLITTVAYKFGTEPACYALEGSIAVTGALVQWLRDSLQIIASSKDIEALAATVEDNGGVYFVPAFSGLFAPHWNANARGAVIGLTRYATRAHIARAALEATAFQTREVLESMGEDAGVPIPELRVDGGMVVNELLMQIQANMLDVPVVRPRVSETTALGAAYAAGLAVGYWGNRSDLVGHWQIDRRWTSTLDVSQREVSYRYWRKAVERTLDWLE
ncbi:MAG: glycerol kinase GlpK [Pseudomonadota bacterium]